MKLKIEIAMDNAAFEDDAGEVTRILGNLATALVGEPLDFAGPLCSLRDLNGNIVGDAVVVDA